MGTGVFIFVCLQITFVSVAQAGPRYTPSNHRVHSADEIATTEGTVINKPDVCLHREAIVVVKSAPGNYVRRNTLRNTWVKEAAASNIPVLFVLGRDANETIDDAVSVEDRLHGDIIQGQFVDDYYNLTLKGIFTYRWLNENCKELFIALVCDDDTLVNFPNFHTFLSEQKAAEARASLGAKLFCFTFSSKKPIRSPGNPWFMPKSVFANTTYPAYCSGSAYMVSGSAVAKLAVAVVSSDAEPKIWIEDVFLTGIAANAAGIRRVHMKNEFSVKYDDCSPADLRKAITLSQCAMSGSQLIDLYEHVSNRHRVVTLVPPNFARVTVSAESITPSHEIDPAIRNYDPSASREKQDVTISDTAYKSSVDGITKILKELLYKEKMVKEEFDELLTRIEDVIKLRNEPSKVAYHNFFLSSETRPFWICFVLAVLGYLAYKKCKSREWTPIKQDLC